jgi:hypothetical protein
MAVVCVLGARRLTALAHFQEIQMFINFANIETGVAIDWYLTQPKDYWREEAATMLRGLGREVAIGKLAESLQMAACVEVERLDGLGRDLLVGALRRVDFYSLALLLVQNAEAADPTLVRTPSGDPASEEYDLEMAA